MPFIADAMLGKLARWLRILGFDTVYEPYLADDALVARARREGRTLLTRDIALHRKASREGIESFLVKEGKNPGMLKEVAPLLIDPSPGSRCTACNSLLISDVPCKPALPAPETECPRRLCPSCGKLYWHGSHWEGIVRTLITAGLGDQIGNSR